MNTLTKLFDRLLSINPQDEVPEEVAENFKHNVLINTADLSFFFFADSFWSINTILPVFAASLTDSPFLIGFIPAIVNAGWFIPQLFLSGKISKLPKVLPLARKLGFLERIPYMFLPLLAFSIGRLENSTIFWLFFVLMIFRGLGSGFVGLPWQEIIARVIPITHRGRFIGFSRVIAQTAGILGSLLSAFLLSKFPYPKNYAYGFIVAAISLWFSYASFAQNREPEIRVKEKVPAPADGSLKQDGTWALMKTILKEDSNFRRYLIARSLAFLGNMGSAFMAVYAIQRFNLGDEQAAIFTSVILVSGMLGYAVWGYLGDRIGPQKIVLISFLTWGVGLVIAILARSIWVYYLVFAMFGLYWAGLNVGDSMLVMEIGDEGRRPTYLGMARTLTGGFLLVAPVLSGWLVERFSYDVMFSVSFVFVIISSVLIVAVKDRPRIRSIQDTI